MSAFDEKYFLKTFEDLIKIDSTTGDYEEIQSHICGLLDEMGISYKTLRKGGIVAELDGNGEALAVTAHFDDIGLMVRHINADGTIKVCKVGGLYAFHAERENVRIHTAEGSDDMRYVSFSGRAPGTSQSARQRRRAAAEDFRTVQVMPSCDSSSGVLR